MAKKRSRKDLEIETTLATANCLMLLSRVGRSTLSSDRRFMCKTCNKQFTSFQALGGHRASHKKLKLMAGSDLLLHIDSSSSPTKAKTHECPICGLDFPMGQALGGHMRRHRAALSTGLLEADKSAKVASIFKNSNNSKRIFSFDLNLTPYENDM